MESDQTICLVWAFDVLRDADIPSLELEGQTTEVKDNMPFAPLVNVENNILENCNCCSQLLSVVVRYVLMNNDIFEDSSSDDVCIL